MQTIYEKICSEHQRLTCEIEKLQQQLDRLPQGKLIVTQFANRYKWYVSENGKQSYLPKDQRPRAEALARRRYLTLQMQELSHEKTAIEFYLKHHQRNDSEADQLLLHPGYRELLPTQFQSSSEKINQWMNTPYEKNPKYPEQLIHRSISGNMLRSKSESMIDMALYRNHIPYRYECALVLGDIKLHPDFTILYPDTQTMYYWEHFGMMDNPQYVQNTCSKLQLYSSCGIYPSVNLITTYETKECPLSSDYVEKLIQYYFK